MGDLGEVLGGHFLRGFSKVVGTSLGVLEVAVGSFLEGFLGVSSKVLRNAVS